MSTLHLREKLVEIARRNLDKVESSRNQASWIKPLWKATNNPDGHDERQPYCAAGMCWAMREWLLIPEVRGELKLQDPEQWRCKFASVFKYPKGNWEYWALSRNIALLGAKENLHTGDFIIYSFSHIEMYTGTDYDDGGFSAVGYNTDSGGSRDGDGCYEKKRSRSKVRSVIRVMQ